MKTRFFCSMLAAAIAWGGTPKPGDPGPPITLTNRSLQAKTVSPTGGPVLIPFMADPAPAGGDLFHVNTSDPAAVVSLITPSGLEITATNAASLGYTFAVIDGSSFPPSIPLPFSPQGTHTIMILPPSSANGVWQVKVDASAASANVLATVEYYSSSQVRAALTTGARQYQQGDVVVFSGLVFENATPVAGATVTVTAGDPADMVTAPTQVTLSDAGVGGTYSGSYTPAKAGTFTAVMNVSGVSASGVSFARTVSTEFKVLPPVARISSLAELGVDDHHVGLIDRVNVTANLTVSTAGSYRLSATLTSSAGTRIIGMATDKLSGGSGKLTVSFAASDLLQLGADGPYAITAMLAYVDDPANPTVDTSSGTTAPYSQQAIDRGSNNLLSVTPVSLDFGSVAAGSTKDLTVTIGNNSTSAFTASAASLSNSAFKVTAPALPFTIPAGGKQALTVRFSPTAGGAQQDTLGVNGILIAITGTGTGAVAGPQISVNPASVDFGAVAVGQPKTATFSVSNTGSASLTVSSFTFSNPLFTAVSPATPFTVAAGAQQTVTLSFNPAAAGSQTGTLALASNAGPASVSLSGTANPPSTGSGGGANGGTTLSSTLTITGSGTSSGGNISASGTVTLSGIGSGAFSSNFNLISAAASGSAPITLTITSGSPTGTLTGTLTGSPTLLGQVLAGTPSASGAATITITGGAGGFAGATGTFSVTASGTGAGTTGSGSGNFSITGTGTISIPSSSGAGGGTTGGGTTGGTGGGTTGGTTGGGTTGGGTTGGGTTGGGTAGAGTCVTPPANLVSWWSGDGNPNDATGGNNGALQGGASYAAGEVGQAFNFDGATGYVSAGNPANLRLTSALTIQAWINPKAAPVGSNLVAIVTKWAQNFNDTPDSDSYGLWLGQTNGVVNVFAAIHQPGGQEPHVQGGVIPLNTWSHVAMTFDSASGQFVVYINGQSIGSLNNPGPIIATSKNVFIGREDSFLPRPFNGLIDEVSIFGRALSAAEIQSIYTAGSAGMCKGSSGGGTTGGGTTGGGTTGSGTSVQLSIDDGTYEQNVGVIQGAPTVYFVNRLTPPSYPATLRAVQIFFSGAPMALRAGDPISVLAGTTSGASNINGVSLARTAAQVNAVGQLNTYNVTPVTIQSGDFVVGFVAANPPNDFLMADDTSSGSKQRSYLSLDGVTFTLTDASPQIAGNFAIRALADVGAGGGTTGGGTTGGSAGTALVSDSFKRADASACALGQADLASGGSGSHFYLPIFPGTSGPVGANIVSGALQNNGLDFGGVQLAASAGACTNGTRGENLGQDLDIRVDLLVPGSPGKLTNAGPYFRSRAAAAGDGIIGGTSAGYWVRLVSTGEIRVTGLNPFALIATSGVPASFNAGAVHTIELAARGSSLQVSLDGAVQTFTQSGASVTTIMLPASGGSNDGTAGIAFSSEDNRGLAGGQRAGNLVISTVK